MPKPIIYLETTVELPQADLQRIRTAIIEATGGDYYVLISCGPHVKAEDFKVFYEKDFTQVKYDELKAIIEESVKQTRTIPSVPSEDRNTPVN